jgi:hypothetical protein
LTVGVPADTLCIRNEYRKELMTYRLPMLLAGLWLALYAALAYDAVTILGPMLAAAPTH